MRRILTATLLTTAISSVAIAFATPPAFAQMDQTYGMDQADSGISLDYFSDQPRAVRILALQRPLGSRMATGRCAV